MEEIVKINTKNTTLLLKINDKVDLIYYGEKIYDEKDYSFLGQDIALRKCSSADDIDATPSIISFVGDGNNRETSVHIVDGFGNASLGFKVNRYYFTNEHLKMNGLPTAYGNEKFFVIEFKSSISKITLKKYFGFFDDCDVLTTGIIVENEGDANIFVRRLMSMQLDLIQGEYEIISLSGSWCNETNINRTELSKGVYSFGSYLGLSSNVHNPFFMIKNKSDNSCIASNLIYSGNHKEIFEKTELSGIRVMSGINDYLLNYEVLPNCSFASPESVFVCGNSEEETSEKMRDFVLKHIINPNFTNKERPIIFNSWEGLGFDINNKSIANLATVAKEIGIEVFVIDDGWFGGRNDDTSSLGDWYENEEKFNGKFCETAKLIKENGLKFGLWFEPEMVSINSEFYQNHSDYAMTIDGLTPIEIRNQIVLDITKEEVQNHLIESLSKNIEKYGIDYIKWDCNRGLTEIRKSGSYFYDYTVSLYKILDTITKKYPNIIMEGCASGGNRFDLGTLCYFSQIWASDNTDPLVRVDTQRGLFLGYPQVSATSHVAVSPNPHTMRKYKISDRFAISAVTNLGYELNLNNLSKSELEEIKTYNEFYKRYRKVLQFGNITTSYENHNDKRIIFTSVSKEKDLAVSVAVDLRCVFARIYDRVYINGLQDNYVYKVNSVFSDKVNNLEVTGKSIRKCGIYVGNFFTVDSATEYNDFLATEIFVFTKIGEV